MKRFFSPTILATVVVTAIVTAMTLFVILPLNRRVKNDRIAIDKVRANITSLQQQQKNIEAVSKNFSTITEQDIAVKNAFLQSTAVVSFFNSLDDLADATGIQQLEKRFDNPSAKSPMQLNGLHLDFTSSYDQAQNFVSHLLTLRPIVHPDLISYSKSNVAGVINVHIDATTPYEVAQ